MTVARSLLQSHLSLTTTVLWLNPGGHFVKSNLCYSLWHSVLFPPFFFFFWLFIEIYWKCPNNLSLILSVSMMCYGHLCIDLFFFSSWNACAMPSSAREWHVFPPHTTVLLCSPWVTLYMWVDRKRAAAKLMSSGFSEIVKCLKKPQHPCFLITALKCSVREAQSPWVNTS